MKVKKAILFLLAVAFIASCCGGCKSDEKAFEIAKIAYGDLSIANEWIEYYAHDIYWAWDVGIHQTDQLSIAFLAKKTLLNEEQLMFGLSYLLLSDHWSEATEEEIRSCQTEKKFSSLLKKYDNEFDLCIDLVVMSYRVNGVSYQIAQYLAAGKTSVKTLTEEYPDYQYTSDLKNLYNKLNSYFEYCEAPDGSYNEMKEITSAYNTAIKQLTEDLKFTFE